MNGARAIGARDSRDCGAQQCAVAFFRQETRAAAAVLAVCLPAPGAADGYAGWIGGEGRNAQEQSDFQR